VSCQRTTLGRWTSAVRAAIGFLPGRGRQLSTAAGLLVALALAGANDPAAGADPHTLEIVSKSGVHVFSVELAITDEDRARGLMFRQELPEGKGMLFDFGRDQEVAMWMKNTLIPLDMMFITAGGRILRIAENTEPMSTRIIPSGGPVRAVLEVIGGTAKKYGIATGDRVAHPWFR
jgi:uncharacterized membrane protein (UPF0127 family)